jgi:hypothetical protein
VSRDPFPEIPRHRKKGGKKKKPFGIEVHYNAIACFKGGWFPHRWYATEKQRDQALIALEKSVCTVLRQCERYRKVNR